MLNNTDEQHSCELVITINNLHFHCEIRRRTYPQLLLCNNERNMNVITNYAIYEMKKVCVLQINSNFQSIHLAQ